MSFDSDAFFSFCPELATMLRTGTRVGRGGKKFEALGALSSVNNLVTLRLLALAFKPERTLEIGLSFGGSCLTLAATHRDLGAQPSHQHVALDPFQKQVWDDTGRAAVEAAGLDGFVDFRPAFSSLELPRLVAEQAAFGLVYIDGSHLFEDVFVDSYFAAQLLIEGGILIFDDCTDPHVRKVLEFIRTNQAAALAEMNLAPYRADQGSSLRYRVAKAVGRTQMVAFRRVGDPVRAWDARFTSF